MFVKEEGLMLARLTNDGQMEKSGAVRQGGIMSCDETDAISVTSLSAYQLQKAIEKLAS